MTYVPIWDDVKEFASKLHDDYWKRYDRRTSDSFIWPLEQQGTNHLTDASGSADFVIWQNKTNKTVLIGRVLLFADGYTPATPYSSGYAYLYRGTTFALLNAFDFVPNAPGEQVFPNVAEYSSRNALRLRNNDSLSLYVNGGPVSTNLSAFIYGEVLPNQVSDKTVV